MWQLEMANTRAMKQHVLLEHEMSLYCPLCYIVFDDYEKCGIHVRNRTCIRVEVPPPGLIFGVDPFHAGLLSRRENGKEWVDKPYWKQIRDLERPAKRPRGPYPLLSEEEKWFLTWDIFSPTSRVQGGRLLSTLGQDNGHLGCK